jgi:hypothetical protein
MTLEQIAAVVQVVALLVALGSIALALYHFWGMITHVRPDRSLAANLLGSLSILSGALYDAQGQRHRESFGLWFLLTFAAVVVGLAARFYLEKGASV